MENIQDTITEMGQLSNLAYISYGDQIYKGRTFQENFTLKDKDGKQVTFYLDDSYTVIDYDNNSSGHGMEAVLLQNNTTGKFVIAFRGTQEPEDYVYDVTTGFLNYNPQIPDARAFVQKVLDNPDYNISTSNLTLTGHSLGGMLTQAIGSEMRIPGYAFNPYGMERLESIPGILSAFTLLGPVGVLAQVLSYDILIKLGVSAPNAQWAKDNIVNVSYTDSGALNGDILSNLTTNLTSVHIGAFVPLIGEDTGLLGGHSINQMNYTIAIYNEILSRFTSDTTYKILTDVYLVNHSMGYCFSDNAVISKDMYDTTNQYFLSEANIFEAGESTLRFNFLNDLSAFQIEEQAKSDTAVLFALIKLNGFAVEGNLSSYSSLNRDNYSYLYIEDRSLLLYHMLDPNNRSLGDLYIKERGYGISVGGDGWNYDNPQILFGYDGVTTTPDAQIVVDVYGFSRGATSARDFINMFNAQYADVNNGSAIGFVGLFDTVATVGLANEYNYNLNLNLNTYSAQQMLHLTANNEFRANFPLKAFHNAYSKPRIAA